MKSTILLTALNAVLFTLISCGQHVDESAMPTTTQTAGATITAHAVPPGMA